MPDQTPTPMKLLCFYIPIDQADTVKHALFEIGAGRIGHYSHCCWQTEGQGQFKPLEGSQPHIGEHEQLETVSEYKIEMVVPDDLVEQAIATLKAHHPYETPAYHIIDIQT